MLESFLPGSAAWRERNVYEKDVTEVMFVKGVYVDQANLYYS